MKIAVSLIPALMLAFVSTAAIADSPDMQAEQQACEADVYTYCSDAIPDHDRIAACLKKNWRKISPACRKTMRNHKRKRHGG